MRIHFANIVVLLFAGILGMTISACGGPGTPTPQFATVTVTFNLGTAGPGFAASIYAQEVSTGKVFKGFYRFHVAHPHSLRRFSPFRFEVSGPPDYSTILLGGKPQATALCRCPGGIHGLTRTYFSNVMWSRRKAPVSNDEPLSV